jgi:predicted amidophosphoribosyltransferase
MPYEHVVRRLLVAHKEHARLGLARPLGLLLAAAVAAALDDPAKPVLLVPIPSMRGTTRSRGHDPVRRMAHAAVASLGGGARLASVLRHRRRVGDQSELSVEQRRENLSHALVASRRLASDDVAVVLVDDICSSGATLAAGAQALLARGVPASVLRGAVVASPPLHTRRTAGHVGTTSP